MSRVAEAADPSVSPTAIGFGDTDLMVLIAREFLGDFVVPGVNRLDQVWMVFRMIWDVLTQNLFCFRKNISNGGGNTTSERQT